MSGSINVTALLVPLNFQHETGGLVTHNSESGFYSCSIESCLSNAVVQYL